MGCATSTPTDPTSVLIAQLSDLGESQPLVEGARVTSDFLELQTRAVKGSTLTSAIGEQRSKAPTVTAFEKVGDGAKPLLQVASDVPSPSKDATVTLFDAKEKAVAVFSCKANMYDAEHTGAVLYARDAPDLSNGKSVLDSVTDSMGQVFSTVPAAVDANGVCMRAVGRIRMLFATGRQGRRTEDEEIALGYGWFLLGADGTFQSAADLFFDQRDLFFQNVKNGKREVVAYRTVTGSQYYVAAGVDAVPVIALTAMADLAKRFATGAQAGTAAGGGGGG